MRPVVARIGEPPGACLLRYVPQGLALFPTLTLAENLDFWARMYGIDRRARGRRSAGRWSWSS